jgi:hypothetical protein
LPEALYSTTTNFGRAQILIGNKLLNEECIQRQWLTEVYAQYSSAIFLLQEKDDPSPPSKPSQTKPIWRGSGRIKAVVIGKPLQRRSDHRGAFLKNSSYQAAAPTLPSSDHHFFLLTCTLLLLLLLPLKLPNSAIELHVRNNGLYLYTH